MFVGSVLYPSPRITDARSKYYVSEKLWPEKYYPPYVSGGGFIMSAVMAARVSFKFRKYLLSYASKRTKRQEFGHFRKERASKRTKRGVKIVVRKNIGVKKNYTHNNVAKFDF
jgi:hypothetical protein